MTAALAPVLTAHWDEPDSFTIEGHRRADYLGRDILGSSYGLDVVVHATAGSCQRGEHQIHGGRPFGAAVSTAWSRLRRCPRPAAHRGRRRRRTA